MRFKLVMLSLLSVWTQTRIWLSLLVWKSIPILVVVESMPSLKQIKRLVGKNPERGHRSTTPPGHRSTTPPGHRSTTPPGHRSTTPPGHRSTTPPGHRSTTPPGHRSTTPPGHRSTTPPGHWSTTPPGHRSTTPPRMLFQPFILRFPNYYCAQLLHRSFSLLHHQSSRVLHRSA